MKLVKIGYHSSNDAEVMYSISREHTYWKNFQINVWINGNVIYESVGSVTLVQEQQQHSLNAQCHFEMLSSPDCFRPRGPGFKY